MKNIVCFLIGFVTYPLAFMPILVKFFPDTADILVLWYYRYLNFLGF